jgi:hypothetical protein
MRCHALAAPHSARPCLLAKKGVKLNPMKYLAMLTLAALAFTLGACAHKDDTGSSAPPPAASTGYGK